MMPQHAYSNQVQDGKGINGWRDSNVGLCRKLLHATAAISVTLPNNSLFTSLHSIYLIHRKMNEDSEQVFTYNSVQAVDELTDHLRQICDIYSDAKVCFDYAYALERPIKKEHQKAIEEHEPLRMLKFTASRLALIELAKLYQQNDYLSLIKVTARLNSKYYGQFDKSNNKLQHLIDKINDVKSQNGKVLGLRDKIFAHTDSRSKIKTSKVYEVNYDDVKNLFLVTIELIKELHELLNIGIARIIVNHQLDIQLNEVLDSLKVNP